MEGERGEETAMISRQLIKRGTRTEKQNGRRRNGEEEALLAETLLIENFVRA